MNDALNELLAHRIVVLDGDMGAMIPAEELGEDDFRGPRFREHPDALAGNNDVLNLSCPEVVERLHTAYLEAGADLVTTNTLNANAIAQADYGTDAHVAEMNREGARIARRAADAVAERSGRPRWVAGTLGPPNPAASRSPDVDDSARRNLRFPRLVEVYREAVDGLLDGGADLVMVGAIADTLVAKAALFALEEAFEGRGARTPVMLSANIANDNGCTRSGQTVEAFWNSVCHAHPFSVGLDCALGGERLRTYIEELASVTDAPISVHPSASPPNEAGESGQTPGNMAYAVRGWAEAGLVNVAGGGPGTTPEHIAAVAGAVRDYPPRGVPQRPARLRLSGREPLTFDPETGFVSVGQRTSVAGSARFRQLIADDDLAGALEIAREQVVTGGAQVIDVNMDDPRLDGATCMRRFLERIQTEPEVARVPVMIDSSRWEVLEAGLQSAQGRSIVNSLSLEEGEETFLEQARRVRRHGAAVVVMALDEQGRAESVERRLDIARRAVRLLTEQAGFGREDIAVDTGVFPVATGDETHNDYARAFLEAVRRIHEALPGVSTTGALSNVSLAFRGNEAVRAAMHAEFLYHATEAGLHMAILDPARLTVRDDIPAELRTRIEDVILNRRPDAGERLLEIAQA